VISAEECASMKAKPIELNYNEEDHNEGLATYFRETLRLELLDWCAENGYNLYKDGLKIYTSINPQLQQMAEETVVEQMKDIQAKFYAHWKGREPWGEFKELITASMKRSDRYRILKEMGLDQDAILANFNEPVKMKVYSITRGEVDTVMTPMDSLKYYKYFAQCGLMSMDPISGRIKAWVGGHNYNYFKYDHVNVTAKRQVGSTFKPFVYTLAIDNGTSPCTVVPNKPVVFEDFNDWAPQNADNTYNDPEMSLFRGLQFSVNNIVLYLMKQLGPNGPKSVVELARKLGITSNLEPYPSIALGTSDVSIYEMVGAFSAYANKGVWLKPVYLLSISDKNGNTIFENKPVSQPVIIVPQKSTSSFIKKTSTRRHILGKSKTSRKVGILIKNRDTRKNVINAQKELKKTSIHDVKKYLKNQGLIKVGTTAPADVLRKTFECSMLAGEITNKNQDVLYHNFLNDNSSH
jgi:penicillin-binding protein 1A